MKTLKCILIVLSAVVFSLSTVAQSHDHSQMNLSASKTETFKVWGICNMCKTRIEKTVKAEGITEAVWDTKTQMLTISYDHSKTTRDDLSKKLASVGHDTEKYKATDEVYEKLPECCHYERAK